MDISYIECFLTVARTLNFSQAARQSYISQSMVSRYIEKLENELGARLFTRTSKSVELTEEGRAFLPYANEIAENMKKARFAVNQLKSGYTGRIKIACDAASGEFAAMCIREFSEKYPGIAVDITEPRGDAGTLSDYDFIMLPRDMIPDSADVEYAITHSDSLMIAVPEEYAKKNYALTELRNEKFVLLSETENPILYMEIMDIFRAARISPEIAGRPDSVESVLIAVSANMGCSLLPSRILRERAVKGVRAAELTDMDMTIQYAAAWDKNSANSAARLFAEIVKKYAEGEEYAY